MNPKVSLILTVYNEEKHLAENLRSLLAQSFKPLEVIVVDDGSTDRSVEIAEEFTLSEAEGFPVRVIKQAHIGLAAARNRGAKKAGGKILVFCDADLTYDRDYVKNLVDPILKGNAIGTFHKNEFVKNPKNFWSRCWQINDHLPPDRRLPPNQPDKSVYFRAIDREQFLKVAGFDDIGYLDDRTLSPKLKRRALGVSGAVCWHYNPETLREVLNDARWRGRSLARNNFWLAVLQHSLPNSLRRIIIDTRRSTEPFYFIFKIIYDVSINLGTIDNLLRQTLAK